MENDHLDLKNKQDSFVSGKFHTDNDNNRYSNLNLNQNLRSPFLIPIHSTSKYYNNKYYDSTVSVKDERNGKLASWFKSSETSHFAIQNDKVEESKDKKPWNKASNTTTFNNSTLSLHIAAYETASAFDSFGDLKNQKSGSFKEKENAKQIFTAFSTFFIQNPFEFPRQQNDKVLEPEVSKYKASQRLFNPNEATNNIVSSELSKMPLLLSTDFKILDVYHLGKKCLKNYTLNSQPSRFAVSLASEVFEFIKENLQISQISVIVFVEPLNIGENFAVFEEAEKHGLAGKIAICNSDCSACSSFIYELRPKLSENPKENEVFCFLYSRNKLHYGCLIQRKEGRFIYLSSACVAQKEDYINLLNGKQKNIGSLNGTVFAEKVQQHFADGITILDTSELFNVRDSGMTIDEFHFKEHVRYGLSLRANGFIGDNEVKECEIAIPCSYYFKVCIGEQEITADTYLMPLPLDIEFRFDLFGDESNVTVTAFRNSGYTFPAIDIPENAMGVILNIHVNECNFPNFSTEWMLKEEMESKI